MNNTKDEIIEKTKQHIQEIRTMSEMPAEKRRGLIYTSPEASHGAIYDA